MMKRRFKLNIDLKNYKIGHIKNLDVDRKELPVHTFWRSRFLDGCLERINESKHKDKNVSKKNLKYKEGFTDDNI